MFSKTFTEHISGPMEGKFVVVAALHDKGLKYETDVLYCETKTSGLRAGNAGMKRRLFLSP
jgi:hypothetical protein